MLWLLLAILLACSGAVSASETALFGLSRQRLHQFGKSDGRLRRRVHRLMRHPRRVLMTVLMTNTAINVAIFTVSFFALPQTWSVGAAVGGALVPLCVITFGEMLPKALALTSPERFAPPAAGLIGLLQIALGSAQWVLGRWIVDPLTRMLAPGDPPPDSVTTEELRLLVDHSARDGVITSIENEMLQSIVAMEDVRVREVMTPRVDIRFVRIDAGRSAVLDIFKECGRRRLPVCGRDLDDTIGFLYGRDLLLKPEQPLRMLVRRPHYVPEQMNLMQLLHHFRTEGIHRAIVVDEFGGTAGLVTSEDVVEWIVGALPDAETPRPTTPTQRLDDNTYRLSGDLSVRLWASRFGVSEIDRHFDTVGGLILAKLGRLPRVGDRVRIRNLTLTVETMHRRRIQHVILRHDPQAAGAWEASP